MFESDSAPIVKQRKENLMGFDVKSMATSLKAGSKNQSEGPKTRQSTNHRFHEPIPASVVDAFSRLLVVSKNKASDLLILNGAAPLIKENKLEEAKVNEAYIDCAKAQAIHLAGIPDDVVTLNGFIKAIRESTKPAAKATKPAAKVSQEAPPTKVQEAISKV